MRKSFIGVLLCSITLIADAKVPYETLEKDGVYSELKWQGLKCMGGILYYRSNSLYDLKSIALTLSYNPRTKTPYYCSTLKKKTKHSPILRKGTKYLHIKIEN